MPTAATYGRGYFEGKVFSGSSKDKGRLEAAFLSDLRSDITRFVSSSGSYDDRP